MHLCNGSGSHWGKNPDVLWFLPDADTNESNVLFEVGRFRTFVAVRTHFARIRHRGHNLIYVVLIKRYETRHLYVEIWKRGNAAPEEDDDDGPLSEYVGNQNAPASHAAVPGTMEFVSHAHATSPGAVGRNDGVLMWQFQLQATMCDIPAGNDLFVGAPPAGVTFDALTSLLGQCRYHDQQ